MSRPYSDPVLQKLDRCTVDAFIKMCGGIAVGSVASAVWFRMKAWPVALAVGVGLGMAYNNCEVTLNDLRSRGAGAKHTSDRDTGELKIAK